LVVAAFSLRNFKLIEKVSEIFITKMKTKMTALMNNSVKEINYRVLIRLFGSGFGSGGSGWLFFSRLSIGWGLGLSLA
jgi:hypothetical protein